MLKTATIVGRGERSRTLLNLLASFFYLPTFENVLSPLIILRVFVFDIIIVNLFGTRTSRLNKLLRGKLRTNREQVILPSSHSKSKKKYSLH